ncbi:MAG: tetratricopeptide repeat protein [Nitrospinae bacterium]|nr:tetratricopeptide repeat protein [Nitrospinota bacterium]
MTRTKILAFIVAIVGSLFFILSYLNSPETWESHNKKGVKAFHEGHHIEAEKHFVKALELAEDFPPGDHRLYFSLGQLAEIYRIQSKFSEAEQVIQRTLEVDEEVFGATHPNRALNLNNLAANYRVQGKYPEAEALLKQALKILEDSFGKDHVLVGNILEHYAYLLKKMDRSAEAEKLENRYKKIFAKQETENQ